jgi:hypothetical protein
LTGREAETNSPGRVSPLPEVLLPAELKAQQSLRMKEHDLSAGSAPLQSEEEVRQEVPRAARKPDEARHGEGRRNSIRHEVRNVGEKRSVTPRPGSAARQVERPSSALPSDARDAMQRTSGKQVDNRHAKSASDQDQPAREANLVSEESMTPVSKVPVESDSHEAMIVRPERITARGRAGSTSRATSEEPTPSAQVAPTIKVTIGRIEVRAILPPAPREKKTALPAPRMSLDDYLKSHSGGRR